MRWLILVSGLLLLVPAFQPQDDAKKLHDALTEKLTKAEAYKFDFSSIYRDLSHSQSEKGSVIVAAGNRIKVISHVEYRYKDKKSPKKDSDATRTHICDGTTLYFEALKTNKQPMITTDSCAKKESFCKLAA